VTTSWKNIWHERRGFAVTLIVTLAWLLAIASGTALIFRYANSPGRTGATPIHWPTDSQIALDANRPTLIMFAHPQCPCTLASVAELDQLVSDCHGKFSAQVWFIKPAGTPDDWTNTDLWAKASAIPDVTVHLDDGGIEAQRFQAETSGQALLYGRDGQLLFQGGITGSRGHVGDNPGCDALEALLNHKLTQQIQTPVFGCPLFAAQCQRSQESVPSK
jgi:hypothetical protein